MILFVSGRCDIPAFYNDWFFHRLAAGFVDVRNPFHAHQISRIPLVEGNVDAIVFCTKNPLFLAQRLDEIPFPYLIHVTLTPYHKDIEPFVPQKEAVIETIRQISEAIGKKRIVVRYDPILLNDRYDVAYHAKAFERLAMRLCDHVETVILSFVDLYQNTRVHMREMGMRRMEEADMHALGRVIGAIGRAYGMKLQTCGENVDLHSYGIEKGACISKQIMEDLLGHPYEGSKGKPVRGCGCIPTVDIGDYNACAHGCKYCYANYDERKIQARMKTHDPLSSVLLGHVEEGDVLVKRMERMYRQNVLL